MEENKVLDTNILLEHKFGLTTIFSIVEYPPALEHCDVLWPQRQDYELSIQIAAKLRKIGRPLPAVDILIASMCINRGLTLLTKDADYKSIKLIEKKFKVEIKH